MDIQSLVNKTVLTKHSVQTNHLATHWIDSVAALATPILLWWCELACIQLVQSELDEKLLTVGYRHDIRHSAPTPLGLTVTVQATLTEIRERKLIFRVQANDNKEQILEGIHERFIVDLISFDEKLKAKRKMAT